MYISFLAILIIVVLHSLGTYLFLLYIINQTVEKSTSNIRRKNYNLQIREEELEKRTTEYIKRLDKLESILKIIRGGKNEKK